MSQSLTEGERRPARGGLRLEVRRKQRATLVGAAVNLPLGLLKLVAGYFGRSEALIADGVHSLSDLVSDAVVLAAIRVGAKSADHDHPYGHARIETVATAFVGMLLIVTAGFIAWNAGVVLLGGATPVVPGWPALAAAVASLVLKEALFWYTRHQARRTRSLLLEANAWHHRSDAASSVVAVVAVAGSMSGMPLLDAVGAVLIAIMLAAFGWRYGWQSLRELVDTGLAPDRLSVVRDHIGDVPGVRRMRRLRTRTMGGHAAYADVGVMVDPYISLSEAHRISEEISDRLVSHVDEIADICIHIEPDGHEDAPAAFDLPLRTELMARLREAWADLPIAGHIERVTLHYLNDAVDVEVLLPFEQVELVGSVAMVRSRFAAVAREVPGVRAIRPLFR